MSDISNHESTENSAHLFNEQSTTAKNDVEEVIAKKETTNVNRVRVLVVLVLVASTIGIALGVYFYTSNTETEQFEKQFHDDALKVLEETGTAFERTLSMLDLFSTTLVSDARSSNQTWPFVTIPNFAVKAAKLRSVILGFAVYLIPIVTPANRVQWESYAYQNREWTNETLHIQARDMNFFGVIANETEPVPEVFGSLDEIIPYNTTYVFRLSFFFSSNNISHRHLYF